MKTSSGKYSYNSGYGINHKTGGAASLGTAVPAYRNVTVRPGLGKQMPGSPKHGKHYAGAKITNKR
jgi:hypothetical protein